MHRYKQPTSNRFEMTLVGRMQPFSPISGRNGAMPVFSHPDKTKPPTECNCESDNGKKLQPDQRHHPQRGAARLGCLLRLRQLCIVSGGAREYKNSGKDCYSSRNKPKHEGSGCCGYGLACSISAGIVCAPWPVGAEHRNVDTFDHCVGNKLP